MPLTLAQLQQADYTNPEAAKAVSALTGMDVNLLGVRGGEVYKEQINNFVRQLNEINPTPYEGYRNYGDPKDKTTIESQLNQYKGLFDKAGVDMASSPLQKWQDIYTQGATPGGLTTQGMQQFNTAVQGAQGVTSAQTTTRLNPTTGLLEKVPVSNTVTDTRSLISSVPKTGYIKAYDTNNGYAPVYVPAGTYVAGISATPKAGMTAGNMQQNTTVSVPGGQYDNSLADSAVAGATQDKSTLQAYIDRATPQLTPAQIQEQSLYNNMAGLVGQSANRSAEQLAAENAAGISTMNTDLNNIIGEMTTKEAEYNAYKLAQEGKPVTMNTIVGSIAEKKNQIASELLLLQGKANVLQGKLTTAQANVNRAIDLKYDALDNQYKIYQAQLDALKPTLSREENIRAEAMAQMNKDRQAILEAQKEKEKSIQNVMLEAVKNGASPSVISAITKAKSYEEAIQTYSLANNNGASDSALAWAQSISNGTAKMSEVPSDIRNEVVSALATLPADQSKIEPLKQKVSDIDNLLNSSALNDAVGTTWFDRDWGMFDISKLTGDYQEFVAGVQQLVSKDTLDTLINLKAQGGTLGALSDQERVMLQNAASKISTWTKKDDSGNVVGYNASEKSFKDELNKIKNITQKAIEKAGGSTFSAQEAIDKYYLENTDKRETIDRLDTLVNPNTGQLYSDIEKAQILGISFRQVGGDTKLASVAASIPDSSNGGQCGRFVNNLTGLGLGDSYASKMAKMDKNITKPEAGMVFVMPYKDTGHTGIILSVENGIATVKDSNSQLNEKVRTHQIPVYKMTGFKRVNIA